MIPGLHHKNPNLVGCSQFSNCQMPIFHIFFTTICSLNSDYWCKVWLPWSSVKALVFPKASLIRITRILFPTPGRAWCMVEIFATTKRETGEIFQHTHALWHDNFLLVHSFLLLEKCFSNCLVTGKGMGWSVGWVGSDQPGVSLIYNWFKPITSALLLFVFFAYSLGSLWEEKSFQ